MQLVTDLSEIKKLAQQRFDEFEVMRYMLQRDDDIDDTQLDALVERIAKPIVAAIDCKVCANCCNSLDVYLTPDDSQRLSQIIHIDINSIIDHKTAKDVDEWGKFKQTPCVFLNGKLCSVYDYRPESCRLYPVFTPDFRWLLEDTIEGASLCPIIYNVLNKVADLIDAN